MTVERRFMAASDLRMIEDDETNTIEGYAAVFNSISEDLGGFREIIAPGAFSDAMQDDVRALWNHDANHVLGRLKSGTLAMEEDQRGLRVRISPPQSAGWVIESMKRGDVDQMSFGFRVVKDDWKMDGDMVVRTLEKVRLFDVSVVTYPAYPETSAAVRSLEAFRAQNEAGAPDHNLARARLRLASF